MAAILPRKIGDLTFRQAAEQDDEFIFQTIQATMREYVEQTFGSWEEQPQRRIIKSGTNYVLMRIIVRDGVDIGLVTVEPQKNCFWLNQLYILPDQQGQGFGAMILKNLKSIASNHGLPLRLSVLASNTSARRLYEREGFNVYEITDKRIRLEFIVHK